MTNSADPAPETKKPIGCLPIILIAVLIFTLYSCVSGGSGGDGSAAMAEIQCKNYVKERLKSPSSAEFRSVTSSGGPNNYSVSGKVEATNSFGGRVTNSWSCTAKYQGDGSWLVSASIY